MNTEHLKLVEEIAKNGSICSAAKKLFMSQPNASHMLDILESELGYKLFERSRKGARLTEKGQEFVKCIGTLNRTLANIDGIGKRPQELRFTVMSYTYQFSEIAFSRLCEEKLACDNKMRFIILPTKNLMEAIEKIDNCEVDVAMLLCRGDLYGSYEKLFREHDLLADYLATEPLHISLPKSHPLAERADFHLDDLIPYPCFASAGHDALEDYVSLTLSDYAPFISKMVFCEPGEIRINMVKKTNGFIVSTPFTPIECERYGLVCKAIPGASLRFFTLCSSERRQEELIDRYICFLKEEIAIFFN